MKEWRDRWNDWLEVASRCHRMVAAHAGGLDEILLGQGLGCGRYQAELGAGRGVWRRKIMENPLEMERNMWR